MHILILRLPLKVGGTAEEKMRQGGRLSSKHRPACSASVLERTFAFAFASVVEGGCSLRRTRRWGIWAVRKGYRRSGQMRQYAVSKPYQLGNPKPQTLIPKPRVLIN